MGLSVALKVTDKGCRYIETFIGRTDSFTDKVISMVEYLDNTLPNDVLDADDLVLEFYTSHGELLGSRAVSALLVDLLRAGYLETAEEGVNIAPTFLQAECPSCHGASIAAGLLFAYRGGGIEVYSGLHTCPYCGTKLVVFNNLHTLITIDAEL